MDSSKPPEQVSPNDSDLQAAVDLVAEVGWNQVADDWRLFVRAGSVFGIRDPAGRIVATAAAIPYGAAFGWVSMVLVTASWRRKGLATRLLHACIAELESAGRVPLLDATPDGEQVYVRLGFVPHFDLQRWQRGPAAVDPGRTEEGVRNATIADASTIAEQDRSVFGGDRSAVLRDLLTRDSAKVWMLEDRPGYLLSRKGRIARQLGPLCGQNDDDAVRLLAAALADVQGPVFIDVPDRHEALADLLKASGFTPQRSLRRMAKGRAEPFGDPDRMYALVGPEFG